ncbi:MAG TPA: hypothetical protein VFK69_10590 [Candidatus Eisenbacteria bacterium]|nr:hypothetical protein [Candidatus Eisenbacteria bacterium]
MKRWNGWLIAVVMLVPAIAFASNVKGSGSGIATYYDGNLLTIQFVEFPSGSEGTLLNQNSAINFIYQSDPGLPGGQPFVSVIDAIPTDGFNPLWEEVQIAFTAGNTPEQLFSDTEIDSFATAGLITLTPTGELYRCPVVGTKTSSLSRSSALPAAPAAAAGRNATWAAIKALYRR